MPKKPATTKISKPPKSMKKSKKEDDEVSELEIDETDKIEGDEEVEFNDDEDVIDEDENEEVDDEVLYDEDGKVCNLQKVIEDDNEYYDNDEEIEAQPDTSVEYVKKEERQSSAKLTKYEMVRILGERTKQLTMGAKPLIKNYKGLPYDKISEEELKLNMIPFKIRRPLPNGKYELWSLEELTKEHLLSLLE
jgi:DNA-directed RNA polymerase subunit K/omega